jgi:hypothetical protein
MSRPTFTIHQSTEELPVGQKIITFYYVKLIRSGKAIKVETLYSGNNLTTASHVAEAAKATLLFTAPKRTKPQEPKP